MAGDPPEPEFASWIRRLRAAKALRRARSVSRGRAPRARRLLGRRRHHRRRYRRLGRGHRRRWPRPAGRGSRTRRCSAPIRISARRACLVSSEGWTSLSRFAVGRVRMGVSPHAPYTVSGRLYRATGELGPRDGSAGRGAPGGVSGRERTAGEGRGTFRDGVARARHPHAGAVGPNAGGVARRCTACSRRARSAFTSSRRRRWTSVGWRMAGAAVAHCPRSNRAHGHGDAPLAALLAARIRVGIGTDSVVSVGELDLLAEARAASALAGLDAESGARALYARRRSRARPGRGDRRTAGRQVGRLRRDPAAGRRTAAAPEAMVLASGPRDVLATFVGGRDVYRNSQPL